MQRTVLTAVAVVVILAMFSLGGFYLGRYVLDAEANVRVERLRDRLAASEAHVRSLEQRLEAASADYLELQEMMESSNTEYVRLVERLCSDLQVEYPDEQEWIAAERDLCLTDH